MPRSCTVCVHKSVVEINRALIRHEVYRSVAKRFGFKDAAMFRHKSNHLAAALARERNAQYAKSALPPVPPASVADRPNEEMSVAADSLIAELDEIQGGVKAIFNETKSEAPDTAIRAAGTFYKGLDIKAKAKKLYAASVGDA